MIRSSFILTVARRALLAVVIAACAMHVVTAQEICGLESVQYRGIDSKGVESSPGSAAANVAEVEVEGNARTDGKAQVAPHAPIDLGKPTGYAPKIVKGRVPTITIVSPSEGAVLPSGTFEFRGTFTGPINTGVSVNGSPARTYGNQWVAMLFYPTAGPFEVTAVATAFDGLTATTSRNVTVAAGTPVLSLRSNQPGNIAPAEIGFGVRVRGSVVGNVQIDFDGDGDSDYDGPLSGAPKSYTYTAPGFYTVRATAVVGAEIEKPSRLQRQLPSPAPVPKASGEGIASSSEITIVIVDVVVQRERACAVYGALRAALAANDLEASLLTLTTHHREAMRPFFTALGNNRLVFATRLGTIANGVIGLDSAQLTTLRIEKGSPIGTQLGVAADIDGVWRISSF